MSEKKMTPIEASAFYKLKLLTSNDLVAIAENWLVQDLTSSTAAILAGEMNPIMSDCEPLFETSLKELVVQIPDEDSAIQIVSKIYLRKIKSGSVTPFEGMKAIDNDIYNKVWFDGFEQQFVGEILGLQHMYTWYRELQDAADGSMLLYYTELPKEEAGNLLNELEKT